MTWNETAERAISLLDEGLLRLLVHELVRIPSYTGHEAAIAEHLVERMRGGGLEARYLPVDKLQGSAIGRVGSAGRREVMLYAPIDTLLSGDPEVDRTLIGDAARLDVRPSPIDRGPLVIGLAAGNPKGHAACVLAASLALAQVADELPGSVLAAFGGGGMPTNPGPHEPRGRIGHGVGAAFICEQGARPDAAIIAKPGFAVSHDEVGLCWFRLDVHGDHGYVGSRHRVSGESPVLRLPTVIQELEEWFKEYTSEQTTEYAAPQGMIGALSGGWPHSPAFSPSHVSLYIDLRISSRTAPAEAQRLFGAAVERIERRHEGIRLTWEPLVAIPGTSTPPEHPIVVSTRRAYEARTGKNHQPARSMSGATDANILRQAGIPTARIGMPKVIDEEGQEVDFELGMNAVDVREMRLLTEILIEAACRYIDGDGDPGRAIA